MATPKLAIQTLDYSGVNGTPDSQFGISLNQIDTFLGIITIIGIATVPPASPNDGDCYLLGTGCSGPWATHDNQFAVAYGGWGLPNFFIVKPGMIYYNKADTTLQIFTKTSVWRFIGTFG